MHIAVVGARGQLGAAVVHGCGPRHQVTAFDRAALDITDAAAVAGAMTKVRPEVIVNCAGYNAVDEAEDHPVDALQVNAIAVRTLARAAAAHGAALVHFSSDFVFDGTATKPYTEEDRPNPRSVYATSKMLGEWFAADVPRHYVMRVESLFGRVPDGPPAKGSVEGIVGALGSGRAPKVFSDRTVSPTYIFDAVGSMLALLERGAAPGLYHAVNSGQCTWLEFAQEAARLLGVEPRFEVVRLADVPLRAARPQYCVLSNAKLAATGILMPPWQDALSRYLQKGSGGGRTSRNRVRQARAPRRGR